MSRKILPLLAISMMLISSHTIAGEKNSKTSVVDAVAFCVDEVHKHKVEEIYEQKYYLNFDAYYNPATNRIIDNALVNGDLPPQYVFRKCMTKVGFPLM